MTILHLGVTVMPYSGAFVPAPKKPRSARGERAFHAGYGKGQTTGDIAQILESKYHIMRSFYFLHSDVVAASLTKSIHGSIKNILAGGPPNIQPAAEGIQKIQSAFKHSLSLREYDGMPGVPTKAAMLGVSHRFKRPNQRRPERPSFIDTGLYQASFKAWVD
jgi:hypothetical protein